MTSTNRDFKLLVPISGIFVAVLLLSNVTSQKIFAIGPFVSGGGIILFPIAYIFGDVLTEVYGYAMSRKIIWTGVFCQALAALMYLVVGALPAADFWPHQAAYDVILGFVPRIAMGSIVALFCGEFTNSYVLARMKVVDKGLYPGKRFIVSTMFGEGVDTVVFMSIAFLGVLPLSGVIKVGVTAYVFKVVYEIVMVPVTTRIAQIVKRVEGVDHFDSDTNFNPFAVTTPKSLRSD